jgi:hypothetical protein
VTQQGCAPVEPVFTISIPVDVAATEHHDELAISEPVSASVPKHDHPRHREAGRCDFCHVPLPAFTRLRTRRGWGFD